MPTTCSTTSKKSIDDIKKVRFSAGSNPDSELAYRIIIKSCLEKKYVFNRASDTSAPELKIDEVIYRGVDAIRRAVAEYCGS